MTNFRTPFTASERFWNFAGSHGARVIRDHSVRGSTCAKSWLIRILAPLLFFAPDVHLLSLEKIFLDGQVKQCHWNTFLTKLESDWEQFILYVRTSFPQWLVCDRTLNKGNKTGHRPFDSKRLVPCDPYRHLEPRPTHLGFPRANLQSSLHCHESW